jgi:hypothetical protein
LEPSLLSLPHIVHWGSPVMGHERITRGHASIDLGRLDPVVPEDDLSLFDPPAFMVGPRVI